MTPLDVFTVVKAEFGEHIATLALSINVINRTMKIKPFDLSEKGAFTARLRKKVDKFLWEEIEADRDLAFSIAMQLHTYECCRTLGTPNGSLGGCKVKTLKQLIRDDKGDMK